MVNVAPPPLGGGVCYREDESADALDDVWTVV